MITPEQAQTIGEVVFIQAEEIFRKMGYLDDFCVQAVGFAVVFGGFNRLRWEPLRGFYPDQRLCSAKFLDAFDKFMDAS